MFLGMTSTDLDQIFGRLLRTLVGENWMKQFPKEIKEYLHICLFSNLIFLFFIVLKRLLGVFAVRLTATQRDSPEVSRDSVPCSWTHQQAACAQARVRVCVCVSRGFWHHPSTFRLLIYFSSISAQVLLASRPKRGQPVAQMNPPITGLLSSLWLALT